MPLIPAALQAAIIFLTSATAVNVLGLRLSDLAFLLLFALLFFLRPVLLRQSLLPSTLMLLLLLLTSLSFFFQVLRFDAAQVNAGFANALAIPLCLLLAMVFLSTCSEHRFVRVVLFYVRISLLVCLTVFIWRAFFELPAWIQPGEVENRFSALSNNPNQLALFLLPIPFFSIFCYQKGLVGGKGVFFDFSVVFVLNVLVIGKGLFFSWLMALVFMALVGWKCYGTIRLSLSFVGRRILLFFGFSVLMSPLVFLLFTGNFPGSQEGQGSIRLALWKNGLEAWMQAPLFGHGPGHYSGLDAPYSGMEAHNIFIDWLSAYGILGLLAFVAFVAYFFIHAFRQKVWIVLAFYIALLVQMFFHFYGRQPVFWLWWVFGYFMVVFWPVRSFAADVSDGASACTGVDAGNCLRSDLLRGDDVRV